MLTIYSIYTHLLFASLILSLLLFGLLQKYRQNQISIGILWLALVAIGVDGSMLLSMVSPNAIQAVWWHGNVRLAIYAFIPPAGFLFVYAFVGPTVRVSKYLGWIFVVPLITALAALTNDWHHWFFGDYSMRFQGMYLRASWQPHFLFWIQTGYAYIVSIGILWLLIFWFRQKGIRPSSRGILMVSVTVLIVGSISLDTFGFVPAPGILLHPISLGLINVILIFGVWYLDLLDILPVARETLLRYMSDAVFVVDSQNHILDLNPAAEKIIEHFLADVTGKNILQFILRPERAEQARQILDGEFRGELPLDVGGIDYFFDIFVTGIYIEKETLAAKLIVLRDITERKQMEDGLRVSEERYRLLADASPLAIAVIDLETSNVVYANPRASVLFELPLGQALGTSARDRYVDTQERDRLVQLLREHGSVTDFEARLRNGQGREFWASITSNISIFEGRPAIHSVYYDITERKQAQEKLRQLSRAVEQSPASIIITDTSARIEYVNPRFSLVTGYTVDEVLGKNPRFLNSGQTPPETYKHLWESITAGQEWHGEFINRKKNGGIYPESASISPIFDADGVITHYLAVKEDITQQKAIQRQEREFAALEERQHLARDLHDAVSQTLFSARLTSEMLLRQKGNITPEALWANIQHFTRLIVSALGEMRILLLELRPEGLANTELPILLSHLADATRSRTDAEIHLAIHGKKTLPVDVKIAFYRIAQEALNNIVKHARASEIHLTLLQEDSGVKLIVADSGRGFNTENLAGHQLGVNIMRERAAEVGARFEIASQPGAGTNVTCHWQG